MIHHMSGQYFCQPAEILFFFPLHKVKLLLLLQIWFVVGLSRNHLCVDSNKIFIVLKNIPIMMMMSIKY